jgi:hypothetical protein
VSRSRIWTPFFYLRLSSLSLLRPVCKLCVCVFVSVWWRHNAFNWTRKEKTGFCAPRVCLLFRWCTWRASMTLVLWRLHFSRMGFTHTHGLIKIRHQRFFGSSWLTKFMVWLRDSVQVVVRVGNCLALNWIGWVCFERDLTSNRVGADNDGGGNKELPTGTIGLIVRTDQLFFFPFELVLSFF